MKDVNGENNPNWKGDKVGYEGMHKWVARHKKKPKLCQDCKKVPPYDLANISQEYKRDLDDWEWLCRRCHMNKDGRMKNFKKSRAEEIKEDTKIFKELYKKYLDGYSLRGIAKLLGRKESYGSSLKQSFTRRGFKLRKKHERSWK